jgi:hypothetical protein
MEFLCERLGSHVGSHSLTHSLWDELRTAIMGLIFRGAIVIICRGPSAIPSHCAEYDDGDG